jgi:ACDE family multidrug resistance protein
VAPLKTLFGEEAHLLRDTDFQLLLLANLTAPLGVAVMAAILESLIDPLGATPGNIGLMMSAFTAPAIVMIVIAGVLADRIGRKPVLVYSLLLFGTTGSAIAFTTDFRVALALRVVQGTAWGGLIPIIITSIGDMYDGTTEAAGQGFRFTGSGVSSAVSPVFAGVLVVIAWQFPFLLYALALPIAALVHRYFTEPSDAVGETSQSTRAYVSEMFSLVRRRRVLMYVVARALGTMVWIAFLTYNSLIVVRLLGGTSVQAGVLAGIGSVCFATAAGQAGRITSFYDSRLAPLIVANVCLGGGFLVVLYAPGLAVASVGIATLGLGFGVVLSLYRSLLTGVAPETLRAGIVSVAESGGRVMDTVTPLAMGALITFMTPALGFTGAMRFAGIGTAVVGGVGGIVCLLIASRSPAVDVEAWDDGAVTHPSDDG